YSTFFVPATISAKNCRLIVVVILSMHFLRNQCWGLTDLSHEDVGEVKFFWQGKGEIAQIPRSNCGDRGAMPLRKPRGGRAGTLRQETGPVRESVTREFHSRESAVRLGP